MTEQKWVRRWNSWIAPRPSKPGVWRRKEGGFLVRARAVDARTGKLREVKFTVQGTDAMAAFTLLQEELAKVREGASQSAAPMTTFSAFAASLFTDKVKAGDIKSASGRVKWQQCLEHHLLPAFGPLILDQLRHADVAAWRVRMAEQINAGTYSPHTINGHLNVMRVILKAAVMQLELPRNPMDGIRNFDTSEHGYTEEEPNSLTVQEMPRFLAKMRALYPQHFAFVCLGFFLGHRPSTLRPLRRSGATPDVLLDEGLLLIRQSHTEGDEVMATTKTKIRQRITLPSLLVDVLRWHIATQLTTDAMRASQLLFPAEDGRFRTRSALKKPFAAVADAMGLTKNVTPKAMRRTFQDLARAAEVKDIVTRAISGHATETMQHHYSSVGAAEKQTAIAKVIELAGARAALTDGSSAQGGAHGGVHGTGDRKAAQSL
jgi:site-specific recombinase XerC